MARRHRADQAAEDTHRQITDEADLADTAEAQAVVAAKVVEPVGPETGLDDIRDLAAAGLVTKT